MVLRYIILKKMIEKVRSILWIQTIDEKLLQKERDNLVIEQDDGSRG